MKRIIIILWALLLATRLFADFDLGLRLSANYSYLGMEDYMVYVEAAEDPSNINGFMAGIFVGSSSDNFGIQLEASAPLEGFSIVNLLYNDPLLDVVYNTNYNYEYVNTILMLRYEFDLLLVKAYVGAGLSLGVPVMDLIYGVQPEGMDDFDINQLGYALGVGVVLLDFVDVDLRYISGTTNIFTNEYLVDDPYFGEQVRLSMGIHIF